MQTTTAHYQRPRAHTLFAAKPATLTIQPKLANMSYHRQLSPGSRRLQNPGRASDSFTTDPFYTQNRHNSYTSPRSSGVIPLSSETYVTEQPRSAREPPRGGVYGGDYGAGRPRRSSLVDTQRGSAPAVTQLPSRSKPTVVHDAARPSSPLKGGRDRDYYVTPGVSKEPRKIEHKKIYSVNTDGNANLVAHIDAPAAERHHRRRESGTERTGGYLTTTTDRERGRKDYHATGRSRAGDGNIEDRDAFSYTDPAGMYANTEPRWRDNSIRPRRNSMDRGSSRDNRPANVMVDPVYNDPRSSGRELPGPPPSMRGWESVNKMGRSNTVRDTNSRGIAQSPSRGRFPDAYAETRDPYNAPPPRPSSRDGRSTAANVDRPSDRGGYEYERERETRHERRNSVTRRPDTSTTRRGFGIRADSRDRYARDDRGSDESIKERDRQPYRDSGYAEPHRRDTAPEIPYHEERRLEQEKKDRELARQQQEDRERQYEREKRRDDDRGHDRDYDRERKDRDREYERETDRERERQRMMERAPEREPERERERHHHRRESVDRSGRDRDHRKENGEASSTGLSQAATGGLAGAAAAFGLGKMLKKDKDEDRDKDRDRERDEKRERDRAEREREKEREKEAERKRYEEPPRREDRERRNRGADAVSRSEDSAPFDREPRDDRPREADRGLGFAFERQPEPPKSAAAPPVERPREREPRVPEPVRERDLERDHEDRHSDPPQAALDPEEDYRRRMEQVQREMGRVPVDERGGSDSDPDRERRRREREQRQREKEERDLREPKLDAGIGLTAMNDQPPPPALRRSFEDTASEATAASSQQHGLRRKPSILDDSMSAEPAQIIDNSLSDRRENRVRIVDPPTEEESRRPKGILKQPTQKFPEYPAQAREGALPLKETSVKGIPPGARWTKIDRRLVNPEALEEAKERFEERLDCVIVLRVLTKEEIQKLADRTRELREVVA
ncbi:hypothetical protein LTR78_003098 [Recurvomyces mirabilis]|uniref:DUF8035 domain-containing protein n=1 Tax=Recurvomyces mirabilis TaxID=574656 RepID=A0AAE1C3X0_9PEZI|nr:hypothetical protein LTR78_003098 [Recurvomyces mirabilis]